MRFFALTNVYWETFRFIKAEKRLSLPRFEQSV